MRCARAEISELNFTFPRLARSSQKRHDILRKSVFSNFYEKKKKRQIRIALVLVTVPHSEMGNQENFCAELSQRKPLASAAPTFSRNLLAIKRIHAEWLSFDFPANTGKSKSREGTKIRE